MSQYYNAQRTSGLYVPGSREPFKLSRSKIDLFIECPRCFYLDRVRGVGRPPGYPFTLNSAVDALLKKEFDIHRAKGEKHPMMETYGVDAIPFSHEKMDNWRNTFVGVQYFHEPTNLLIFGAIDDVWIDKDDQLLIVDYKATAKNGEINLDADWQKSYKRQMEIYQWLFRKNDFKVSDTGYFVYVNGQTDKEAFDAKLEFDVHVIPYKGDGSWIEGALKSIYNCLNNASAPEPGKDCDFCAYHYARCQEEDR